MILICDCERCEIASCEERSYYDDDRDSYFNEDVEYEKEMDRRWSEQHANDPDWAK